MYLCSVVLFAVSSSNSIRQKTNFILNRPLNMTITSVKIKRSDQHSIRRQLNLNSVTFSASPSFRRKSPGKRLLLTYVVKGTGMRRSDKRQSQSPSDKDGGLTAPTWLVPTCFRRASTSARTRVVWGRSPRVCRDDWVSALTTTPTTP